MVLFRTDAYSREEYLVCNCYVATTTQRSYIRSGRLVVGRYSVLPFYRELEVDLAHVGSRLINSYEQHRWIADFSWYQELTDVTPLSWTEREFPYAAHSGPFVVKGATNSKKHQWATHMFAQNKAAAVAVAGRLHDDGLVGTQPLIYREYVPLATHEVGISGLPFTNEWRFFFLGETPLAWGYYWSEADQAETRQLSPEGLEFALSVAGRVAMHVNFFVLDIAEKAEGGWTLVEINDGQMSGVSMCDPEELYKNLAEGLASFRPA